MKSDFKTKLIAHMLNKKGSEKGFTLIELLVVIIIIGILAAIALPSFLNQANKSRQSEAKTYVGSINRVQQAYFAERQQFAPNLALSAAGIPSDTENYGYGINRFTYAKGVTGQQAYAYGLPKGSAAVGQGNPVTTNPDTYVAAKGAPIKAYAGVQIIVTPTNTFEPNALAVLCEANQAGVNIAGGSPATDFTYTAAFTTSTIAVPICVTNTLTGTGWSPIS